MPGTLTVTAATLTVTAANETKTYGAVNPTLTVTYSGFVNGDTAASLTTAPTVSTTATTSSAVGTYPITASGAASPNYTISYVGGTLTVTPAPLTVTAANETKAYGAANPTLDGELQRLRQRRHGDEPDDRAHGLDDRYGLERRRHLSDHGERCRRA